jgi:hypothetical protein
MNRFIFISVLIILVSLAGLCLAGIPKMINYQGMLTGSDGKTPVTNGNYSILFSIYNTSSGGSSLWSHTYNLSVTNGLFNVILGDSSAPINLPFDTTYWLGIKVGADAELSPRIRLTSVGYAYRASVADSAVASPPPSTGGGWTDDGTNVRLTTSTDKVGIGTSSPDTYSKLHIVVPRTQSFDRVTIECPRDSNGFGIELKQPNGYWRLGHNTGNGWAGAFFITNGVSPYYRLTILSDGKVGVGTTSPGTKLDVSEIARIIGNVGTSPSWPSNGKGMELAYDSTQHKGYIQVYDRNISTWGNLYLGDGNVGIGTSPGTKLDVTSSSGTAIRASVTSAGGWGIEASAKEGGAHIGDADGSGHAYIGHGNTGCEAYGNEQGGYFKDGDNSGDARLGYADTGIVAYGYGLGGRFKSTYSYAGVGNWNAGVVGYGSWAGGDFSDMNSSSYGEVGYDTYKIFGNGSVDFVQNHPYEKDRVIVYAAPEGDETATYTRGTARLINGEARVILGETFKLVTNPDIGLTAHVTPRGDCKGLYVASLTTSEMVVKELQGGTSDVTFDYLVYGLRIGFEEASVVQEKQRESYIPSMASHRERYGKYPELRHFNALERFRQMYSQIGKPVSDMNSSRALKDAIHEFDPAVDKLPERADHK